MGPVENGGRPGVEPCPPALQAGALPRELVGRFSGMAEGGGVEPPGHNACPGFQIQLPAIQRHPPLENGSPARTCTRIPRLSGGSSALELQEIVELALPHGSAP